MKAVLERSGLLVANDSAALHLGVGLGLPVVGIYGPTDPAEVGPYRRPESVVWAGGEPTLHYRSTKPDPRGIGAVEEEAVRTAVRRVLHTPPAGSSLPPEPAPKAVS
jgi:ADP-heptose:LPS heptosyltransferase